MANKKLFAGITAAVAVLGVGAAVLTSSRYSAPIVPVYAAAGVDDSKEKWSAIGTINGTNWNTDFPLAYDAADDRYELVITLAVNNEFKVRLNNGWTTSIGYGGNTGSGISTYLTNGGGNFKVKTAGTYTIFVKDDKVANYGDKSYGFGIEPYSETIATYSVTFHFADGDSTVKEYKETEPVNLLFKEVEGKRLEGWYTEPEFVNKFVKGTKLTKNVDLYPNYVDATDYNIFVKAEAGSLTPSSIYMWCEEYDGHTNADWPGSPSLKLVEDNYYVATIDASKNFDKIIINDGKATASQTVNIDLPYESAIINISKTKDGNNFKASVTTLDTKALNDYIMAEDVEGQCNTKFYVANAFYLSLDLEEQNEFSTLVDYADAKTRFEAWGRSLGLNPYAENTGSANGYFIMQMQENSNGLLFVVLGVFLAIGTFVIIKKTRKSTVK